MTQQAIVIGLGQLGVVFSEGLLREGVRVVPVLRSTPPQDWQSEKAAMCVLAVGEEDLAPALAQLPSHLLSVAVLMQNELRPLTLQELGLTEASVCIAWFEKKPGRVLSEVRPSVVTGAQAPRLAALLERVGVHSEVTSDEREVAHQLVLKNLYILGLNLFGLQTATQTKREQPLLAGELLGNASFDALISELISLEQVALSAAGQQPELDEGRLRHELERAIEADPSHACAGRSAPARLRRTHALARRLGHATPLVDQMAKAGTGHD